jgi:hypothetical protein
VKIYTTIRNTLATEDDMEGVEEDEVLMLRECQQSGVNVQVLSMECEPGYYNVMLPNNTIIIGLSWYHLDGFTQDGVDVSEL